MISEEVAKFIEGAVFVHAGTRDRELAPSHHLVGGIRVGPDRRTVAVRILGSTAGRLRENLDDNGCLSITCSEDVSHRSYQLKGKVVEVRDATDEDLTVMKDWMAAMKARCDQLGYPPEFGGIFTKVVTRSSLFVSFRVDEIFDQTPGPRAGQPVPSPA